MTDIGKVVAMLRNLSTEALNDLTEGCDPFFRERDKEIIAGIAERIADYLEQHARTAPVETLVVSPDEYARVMEIMDDPGGPTEAALRGAAMLRDLAKLKRTAPVSDNVSLEATPEAMPEMRPSADFRMAELRHLLPITHPAQSELRYALIVAHRDGVLAERARSNSERNELVEALGEAHNRALEEAAEYVLQCGMGSNGRLLAQGIRSLITPSKEGER